MSKLSKRHRRRASQGEARPFDGMRKINTHAAGVDIGAHAIMACVPDGDDQQPVRAFGTYTADLDALADWFVDRGIETVAMESTGVYGIPLFETLEARGIQGCLSSAQAIKDVPGRQSDVRDCQWIQTLHSYGLLKASFRPDADLVALRTLLRHRAHLIAHRAPHVLHMQKALLQMHIQLSQVLRDLTGTTGQRIIRAMIAGERDPHTLAALRNYRCQKDEDELALALTGTWREEQQQEDAFVGMQEDRLHRDGGTRKASGALDSGHEGVLLGHHTPPRYYARHVYACYYLSAGARMVFFSAPLAPNAAPQPLPEAGAQRTLEAVG